MTGELKKLKIEAYEEITYDENGKVDEVFVAMFNPASYSEKYEIEYNEDQAQGTSGSSQNFGRIKPQEYTFEFLIDGTGAAADPVEVDEEVARFLTLTYQYEGGLHRPYYLKLSWGRLVVRCIMKSANVSYTLFKPDGFPLRAKINATFSEISDDELRAAEEERSSPDLTHYRQVKDGDTLPLMCHRIYGDIRHYLAVAEYNGLIDFRSLETGRTIAFPPLADLAAVEDRHA
jgi:hypothetical protein